MTRKRKKLSRRGLFGCFAGVGTLALGADFGLLGGTEHTGAARAADRPAGFIEGVPITGKAGPDMELFDPAIVKIMDRHGVPGAAFALTRNGKLVLAKGYGWANADTGDKVQPDTRFSLASLSKSITAVAVLKLVEDGALGLDDRVFDILKDIRPMPGASVDPRLLTVTVRQCLNHSGGWDRAVHGDPVNWEPQICRAYRIPPPLTPAQFISFAMGLPLQFDPGTEAKYSNIGFILAGEIIAKVSGQPYSRFVEEKVLGPMGIKRIVLQPLGGRYLLGMAMRHLSGSLQPLPPMHLPMVDAAGGWVASGVDMVRFLCNLDGSRGKPVLSAKTRGLMREPPPAPIKKRDSGTWFGLGWDIVMEKGKAYSLYKEGSYQGMRTFMKRLPGGQNWALLYDASMEFDPADKQMVTTTAEEVHQLVEKFDKYPDIDLFDEYP
jgi:N-acyl-D-amino-acid deacylase